MGLCNHRNPNDGGSAVRVTVRGKDNDEIAVKDPAPLEFRDRAAATPHPNRAADLTEVSATMSEAS